MKPNKFWRTVALSLGALALAIATQAQVNTNPVPNLAISWSCDEYGFDGATGGGGLPVADNPAGLALATNWNDTWNENNSAVSGVPPITVNNLWDITGAATSVNLTYAAYNGWPIVAAHAGPDANGTYNRELLNGYLNAGPASWGPNITNSYVTLTNIPYANYDVVVYFSTDTSGRHFRMTDGTVSYYGSTVGSAEVSGANALFLPTTQTDSTQFPNADFAFFPGETNNSPTFSCYPLSGNDQWLGIAGFQVIQASNTYVLYGASPAAQIVPVGQPASFSVMAGGLNPSYQWRHAGTNILNATNATYSIASTVAGQDGNYDVVVTNSFSSVTSVVATLTFYAPKTLQWDGIGSTWDTSSPDWTLNGGVSTTNYTETDNVRFDPLGVAQSTISLSSTFAPTSITISNAGYTFTSGGLAGSGSLHLTSNASLILDTIDTRTGPTLIDSGSTLQLDNGDTAGGLGSGALTNNGALEFDSSGSYAYGFPIFGSGSITNLGSAGEITLGASINASYLDQAGSGQLLLQGANNLTGGLVVDAGTVLARVNTSLGSSAVLLNGGELQLTFANDFTGSAMTLAGGLLHGGIGGNNSYDGTVSLAVDSIIEVDGGDTFTLNSAAGIAGGGFNLFLEGGAGTLILVGTNNSWASVTINAGTLQIGNGGTIGSLGGGTIDDAGALTFDLASDLVVTNPITDYGAINQNGAGTVTLTADNNSAGFYGTINVTNGTLLVNGTSGSGIVTVANGTLGGTGTINGPVTTLPGATLSAGPSVGTLTINSDLAIGGNVVVKVNKSLVQSNDLFVVTGALSNTGAGIVNVENLGTALAVGDKFTLFSQPVTSGDTLTVTGGGAIWTNNLAVDGSISVLSTTVPHPVITGVAAVAGTGLVFSGTNGMVNGTYHVLSSTNLTQTNWTVEATNTFDGSGNFSVTNAITPGTPQKFYRLQVP
jgi:autotransporter-associated beta strand protein